MAGGQAVTTAQGDTGKVDLVRLRSRKSAAGSSSATFALSSQFISPAQGTLTYQFQAPAPEGEEADWVYRSTGAGVTLAEDFRTDAAVNDYVGANGMTNAQTIAEGYVTRYVEEDGTSCLKIRTPPGAAGAQTNGRYWGKYLEPGWTTLTDGIGHSERWIQWRMKVPASRLVNPGPAGTGGWKCIILGGRYNNTTNTGGSSMLSSHVITDGYYRGFPNPYVHSFQQPSSGPGLDKDQVFGSQTLTNMLPGFDRGYNTDPHERYCIYNNGTSGQKQFQGCPWWPVETWFTMMMRVKIATYSTTDTVPPGGNGNEYDVFWAMPGDTSWTQIIAARDYPTGQSPEFINGPNSVVLTTYETGRTQEGPDTYVLYRQLICSTQEIPLPVADATLPEWVPPAGEIGIASLNTLSDVNPCPPNNCTYSAITRQAGLFAWCGMAVAPTLGTKGSIIFTGGGDQDYLGNEWYQYNIYNRVWAPPVKAPYASWVVGPSGFTVDETTGEFYATAGGTIAGTPPLDCEAYTQHTYDSIQYIPGVDGGNTNGYVIVGFPNWKIQTASRQRHWLNLDTMKVERIGNPLPQNFSFTPATYDWIHKRFVVISGQGSGGFPSNAHWMLPMSTKTWTQIGTGNTVNGHGNLDHYQGGDLLFRTNPNTSGPTGIIRLTVFDANSPGVAITPTITGTGPQQSGGGEWVEEKRAFYYYEGFGSKVLFRLRPTGNPRTAAWQWDSETLTFAGSVPIQHAPPSVPHYSRLRYIPSLKGFLWLAKVDAQIHLFRPSTLL